MLMYFNTSQQLLISLLSKKGRGLALQAFNGSHTWLSLYSFLPLKKKVYLFNWAGLGLCCCARAFSSCGKLGPLSSCCVQSSCYIGLSCCGTQALGCAGFSTCGMWAQQLRLLGSRAQAQQLGTWAQLLHGMWDPPGLGVKPMSPELASGLFTDSLPLSHQGK